MSEQTAVRKREVWVDDVKVIACILVVLGHFFHSMTKAGIVPAGNLYEWFNTTIITSMCRCSLSVAGIFTRSTARWTVSRAGRKTC